MAPSAVETHHTVPIVVKGEPATEPATEPLTLSGALESFDSFDVTPIIGREFPKARLVEWLDAPNSDELLRDLAITSKTNR